MRDGWKEISLEDLETTGVIKLGRGDVISKKDMEADPGPYPVYSSAENKNGMIGTYAKFMFEEELITWSVDGGGHLFYRPKHKFSVTNIGGWLRILDHNIFSYQFLTYALQQLHKQNYFDWQHKAHPSVIRKLYSRIPLPPLPEQKRIVDLISSVDSYIEALHQKVDKAIKTRNAVLHELLTKGGDDWVEKPIKDLTEIRYGYTESANTENVGPKFLRITDIQEGKVEWGKVPFCIIRDKELKLHKLQHGDLVFARTGATTGKSYLIQKPPEAVCASYLIRMRPLEEKVDSHFLSFFFQSIFYWDQLLSRKSGSAQGGVNASKLGQLKINLPPLAEQKRIVEIISVFDNQIEALNSTITITKKLRSALLSDLLSGNHEIPTTYDKLIGAA